MTKVLRIVPPEMEDSQKTFLHIHLVKTEKRLGHRSHTGTHGELSEREDMRFQSPLGGEL